MLKTEWSEVFKTRRSKGVISVTVLDNAGVTGHVYRVIVGLNKSFSKRHNVETSLKQA